MKKILKTILDKLLLLVIALVAFAAIVGIVWYFATADLREIEKRNHENPAYQKMMADKEKEEKEKFDSLSDKKKAEAEEIADFEKSIHGKYTKEYLSKKASSDKTMSARLFEIGNYKCISYGYIGHNYDDDLCYDELSYYVFKNKKHAQKAFATMKEKWIESETDSAKNYIQGWEADVMDAEVETFIYLTDNMIITADLQVVSGWAEPADGEANDNSPVEFYYRKKFIMDNF